METIPKYLDTKYTLKERKVFFQEQMKKRMNPFKDFNPETFDPIEIEELKGIQIRERKIPIGKLPTYGLKPKEIMEGQMIGMYESKQDIYLILAHKINELQDEIAKLKKK